MSINRTIRTNNIIEYVQNALGPALEEMRKNWKGQEVRLKDTVYPRQARGRLAVVENVILDERSGLLFLCMVQRVDGTGPRNDDGWTRSYRPLSDFDVCER